MPVATEAAADGENTPAPLMMATGLTAAARSAIPPRRRTAEPSSELQAAGAAMEAAASTNIKFAISICDAEYRPGGDCRQAQV